MSQCRTIIIQCVFIGCLLFCVTGVVLAQSSPEFLEEPDEFFKALSPKPPSPKGAYTIKGRSNSKGAGVVVPDDYKILTGGKYPMARSLILFDFDSDVVKEESYPILRNLAEVLTDKLPNIKLLVVGHTDGLGSDEYNMDLSERRAKAVRKVLVSTYAIDSNRLILRWYGEWEPLIKDNIEDARNRRVEFIRVQ